MMLNEDEFHFILRTLARKGFWEDNDTDGFYDRETESVSFYIPETGGRITIDWPEKADME